MPQLPNEKRWIVEATADTFALPLRGEFTTTVGEHTFFEYDLGGLEETIQPVIRSALRMVWNKHFGTPTDFTVIYRPEPIRFPGIERAGIAEWNTRTDVFQFCPRAIAEAFSGIGIGTLAPAFIVAAHETMHRVQYYRGVPLEDSRTDPGYEGSASEDQAWNEALDAVKAAFPDITLLLKIHGREYRTPDQSSYRSD